MRSGVDYDLVEADVEFNNENSGVRSAGVEPPPAMGGTGAAATLGDKPVAFHSATTSEVFHSATAANHVPPRQFMFDVTLNSRPPFTDLTNLRTGESLDEPSLALRNTSAGLSGGGGGNDKTTFAVLKGQPVSGEDIGAEGSRGSGGGGTAASPITPNAEQTTAHVTDDIRMDARRRRRLAEAVASHVELAWECGDGQRSIDDFGHDVDREIEDTKLTATAAAVDAAAAPEATAIQVWHVDDEPSPLHSLSHYAPSVACVLVVTIYRGYILCRGCRI
jgi:hypothetical protein